MAGFWDLFKSPVESAGTTLVQSITGLVGKFVSSPTEKAESKLEAEKLVQDFTIKLQELAQQTEEMYIKDVEDARANETKIQETPNASWLAKNFPYIMDAFIMLIWGALAIYITGRMMNFIESAKGVDMSGVWGMFSAVTALATTVLTFHRGSSKASEDKTKFIQDNITNGNNKS